jgi:CelD/BcsL family acetyltransferase involved in cellulose biosynthesis
MDRALELRDEWNSLVARMRYPTVFSRWEWMAAWWAHFAEDRGARIIVIHDENRLVGILPLYLQCCYWRRDWRIGRVLRYFASTEVYPDHLDIIAAPGDAGACVAAAFNHLRKSAHQWDVIQLPYLAADSALAASDMNASVRLGPLKRTGVAAYISNGGGYEDYLRGLSGNERQKIRSRRRKLLERKGVTYESIAPHDYLDALSVLFALHEKRALQKGITSTFRGQKIQMFHRQLVETLPAQNIWLRALRWDGTLVALFYGYRIDDRVFYFQMGHDPDKSDWSMGSVILQETIREALEVGVKEYNFLQGDEEFKFRWSHEQRSLFQIEGFGITARGALSSRLATLRDALKGVRALADRATSAVSAA